MRRYATFSFLVLFLPLISLGAFAQRGVGEDTGLARQGVRPELKTISGTVEEVHIAPCEATTGRSILGAHLFVRTDEGARINMHLGPAVNLEDIVEQINVNDTFTAKVFHTPNLTDDAVIARTLSVGEQTFTLRDETLRPVWAGPPANRPMRGRAR